MYSLFIALPLENPALLLTWRPPAVKRVVLFSPRLLVNCPLVPHCSPLFLASLPPGFPRNPNVLLIRTHPNPFPSVANSNVLYYYIYCIFIHISFYVSIYIFLYIYTYIHICICISICNVLSYYIYIHTYLFRTCNVMRGPRSPDVDQGIC
jgi:hypothetical protein